MVSSFPPTSFTRNRRFPRGLWCKGGKACLVGLAPALWRSLRAMSRGVAEEGCKNDDRSCLWKFNIQGDRWLTSGFQGPHHDGKDAPAKKGGEIVPTVYMHIIILTTFRCFYFSWLVWVMLWIDMNSIYTSRAARGGGGSFKNRKRIGEIGCCESRMTKRKHRWIWLTADLSNWLTD